MKALKRNFPFIKSIFHQANRYKGQEMLRHANGDKINAVSEIVLNLLKKDSCSTSFDVTVETT